jgi:hypothetical protein
MKKNSCLLHQKNLIFEDQLIGLIPVKFFYIDKSVTHKKILFFQQGISKKKCPRNEQLEKRFLAPIIGVGLV